MNSREKIHFKLMISFVTITDVTDDYIAVSRLDKAHSHDHPGGVEMTDFPDGGPLVRSKTNTQDAAPNPI
jgi:hypothetical protein